MTGYAAPQVVITMPLLEGLDGVRKMSKSYGNYIGITESASEIYGKVMSISDLLMVRYYELLSDAPGAKVEDLKAGRLHPKQAKEDLAFELTERYSTKAEAEQAAAGFKALFSRKETPDVIEEFSVRAIGPNMGLAAIIKAAGLAKSTSDAMRLIEQGGVKVNGERVIDEKAQMSSNKGFLLQVGKRFFKKIVFEGV